MKGFTPTAESHGFRPDLLWSGCRATKSRRSRSESAKLSGAPGLPAVFLEGLSASPPPSHNEDGQERRLSSFSFINNHPENSY
jgi:hypothetical protein